MIIFTFTRILEPWYHRGQICQGTYLENTGVLAEYMVHDKACFIALIPSISVTDETLES